MLLACLHAFWGPVKQKQLCSACGYQRVWLRKPQSSFTESRAGEGAECWNKIFCSQHSDSLQLQLLLKSTAELLRTKHFACSGKKSVSESKIAHNHPSIVLFGNLPLLKNPFLSKGRNDENNIPIRGFDNVHLNLPSKISIAKNQVKISFVRSLVLQSLSQ